MTVHLGEAERIATGLHDRRRLGWVASFQAFHASLAGDLDRAVEAGQRALDLGTQTDDARLAVHANYGLGIAYYSLGEYGSAAAVARANASALVGDRLRESPGGATLPSVMARGYLALSLAELGAFDEAARAAAEALRLATGLGHRYSAAAAALATGVVEIRRGEPGAAVAPLTEGLELCRAGEFGVFQPYLASALGLAHTLCGDLAEALPLLEGAVEQAAARDLRLWQSRHLSWLAEGYLWAGRRDEARTHAERAQALARARHERGIEAWTLRLLGEIAARESEPGADDAFAEALAMADARGMQPLAGQCRLGLGALHARRGQVERARHELRRAADIFRALGMTRRLAATERLLTSPEFERGLCPRNPVLGGGREERA